MGGGGGRGGGWKHTIEICWNCLVQEKLSKSELNLYF